MRQVLRTVSLPMLALFIALSGFFVLPLCSGQNSGSHIHGIAFPILTATITSPADGTVIQAGDCFQVTAAITATEPEKANNIDRSLFGKSVYAGIDGFCPVSSVSGTIAVTGNAVVDGSATKYASSGLKMPHQSSFDCPTEVTLSWQVCCTGPGAVTITVTPGGEYYVADSGTAFSSIVAWSVSSVYASSGSIIPAENLISDTITIYQQAEEDFSQKLISESGSSGSGSASPSNVTTVNTWAHIRTAQAGQQVIVYANIANRGETEGPYVATLKINGAVEEVKTGILQGNTAVPLKFMVSRDDPGTYEVDVNGQKTYFTVIGEASSKGISAKDSALIAALALLAALIVALVVLIVHRRQRYQQ